VQVIQDDIDLSEEQKTQQILKLNQLIAAVDDYLGN